MEAESYLADHHSNTRDSEATDDEKLLTTIPKQRQGISPNATVVPASHPNNNCNPILASQLRTLGGNAEPARDNDTAHSLELHHRPCHARQELPNV